MGRLESDRAQPMRASALIICPAFPPARGGVADHTRQLARELGAQMPVAVLTSARAEGDTTGMVYGLVTDWKDPHALVATVNRVAPAEAVVIWQYVPHLYGRGGVNLGVPRALAALRRAGRRQLVIAHEIAAPFSPWPHRCWYALAHRWQWRGILGHADAVGFSTEAWLREWGQRAPGGRGKFLLLPSPSGVPVASVASGHRRRWREEHRLSAEVMVLAYFGTLSAAKPFAWMVCAWCQAQRPDRPVALVAVGDRPALDAPPGLTGLFKPLGYLPGPEVSAALHAADVLALPFIDGVSERRTTFMAGLSHGCAVVTTVGRNTGPTLREAGFFKSTPPGAPTWFSRAVAELLADDGGRRRLGEAGRAAYVKRYDWPVVLDTLNEWWASRRGAIHKP